MNFCLGDERMRTSLLRRPPFKWVDVEQAVHEVDESLPVGHFYTSLVFRTDIYAEFTHLCRPRSASSPFVA